MPDLLGKRAWIVALVFVVLGVVIRTLPPLDYWLNFDEGINDSIVHAPTFAAGLKDIARNAHPPLYYAILALFSLLGEGFFWLRLPSLLLGGVSIFAMFLLCRELGGPLCGLLGAFLMMLAPGVVTLSGVARPYMALMAPLLLALYQLARYLRARGRRQLVGYGAFLLLAVLVHYSSLIVLFGIGAVLFGLALSRRLRDFELRDLGMAHAPAVLAIGLLYVFHIRPHMMHSAMQKEAQTGWLSAYFTSSPGELWHNFLGAIEYASGPDLVGFVALAFIACLGVAIVARQYVLAGLAISTLIVAVVLSALSLYPFGCTRHSIYLTAVFVPTISYGLSRTIERADNVSVAIGVALIAVVALHGVVNRVVGVEASRSQALPELIYSNAEMSAVRAELRRLKAMPGLLILDQQTSYVLEPILRHGRGTVRSVETPPCSLYTWGRRQVVATESWILPCGPGERSRPGHLAKILRHLEAKEPEIARLFGRDVRVLSAQAGRVPNTLIGMTRPKQDPREILFDLAGRQVVIFRFRPRGYLALLEAARRGR